MIFIYYKTLKLILLNLVIFYFYRIKKISIFDLFKKLSYIKIYKSFYYYFVIFKDVIINSINNFILFKNNKKYVYLEL